jgi:hypothetical protein
MMLAVDPIFFLLGVLVLGVVFLCLREVIENAAERIVPFLARPWQHYGVQIVLWLIALMVFCAIAFEFNGRPRLF